MQVRQMRGSACVIFFVLLVLAGLGGNALMISDMRPVLALQTTPGFGSSPGPGSVIDVGTVLVGTAISANLVVFEVGNGAITVTAPTTGLITGPNAAEFAIVAGAPPFTIADGGAAQSITLRCIPSTVGQRTATLTLATDAPGQSLISYPLLCTGSATVGAIATPAPAITPTVVIPATGQVIGVKGLAVRTGPYLGASLIAVARPGQTYSITARNQDESSVTWYLITAGKFTGWVSGRFLKVSGSESAVPVGGSVFDQIDGSADIGVRLITEAIIDLRRRPSPRVERVVSIPAGTEIVVLGRTVQERQTFWLHVSYNGQIGWIPSLPVDLSGPVEDLPVR